MSKRTKISLVTTVCILSCAAHLPAPAAQAIESDTEIVFGIGGIGVLDDKQFDLGFVRWRFPRDWYGIRTWAGADVIEGGAFWMGAGLRYDLDLNNTWRIELSSGPGYYEDGGVLPLGNSLEFISTLEISAKVGRDARVGVSFGHISNARTGNFNPGSEIIRLSFGLPFGG